MPRNQSDAANTRAFAVERSRILGAFSENVKKARAATPHSQEALARIARIHRTEVSQIERAQSEPRLLTILILAGALSVTPAVLLDGLPVPQERRSPNYPKRGE
jgi:transcriptional regulator with XRE-family HTH domain